MDADFTSWTKFCEDGSLHVWIDMHAAYRSEYEPSLEHVRQICSNCGMHRRCTREHQPNSAEGEK